MSKNLPDGLLVVFEGIDGVGKTTQLELVKEELASQGWPLHSTRNLGGTPIGEQLREIILSPAPRPEKTNLYISAAIQEALIESVATEREKGKFILLDRGPLSLAAYEIYGGRLDDELVWRHVDQGMKHLRPELVIIYSTGIGTALNRARQKSPEADYFESKSTDYFERVAAGYAEAAKRYPNCATIDGNGPVDTIHQATMSAINKVIDAKAA